MKINVAAILFLILAFAGCRNKYNSLTALVCCTLENTTEKYIVLQNENTNDTIFTGANTEFKKKIHLKTAAYFILKHGREVINIYIKPGDSLCIHAAAEKFNESVRFSGLGCVENTFLLEIKHHNEKNPEITEFTDLDENTFIKKNEYNYKKGIEFIEKYVHNNKNTDQNFVQIEKLKCLYLWAETNTKYESAYNSYLKKNNQELSQNFQIYLSKVNFNDSSLTDIFEYRTFIESYLNMKASLITKYFEASCDLDFFNNKINMLLETVSDKKVKNRLLRDYFRDHIKKFGIGGLEALLSRFNKECCNPKYINEVKISYDKWDAISKGRKAIDFSLPDQDGKLHTLSEFKGKFLYIDVWATWCAPCRRETPFMQKLYQEYKNKNVVFVSISVDESVDAWEKMIEAEKPQWLQLHADNSQTTFLNDYIISSIPRFILIDQNGIIVAAQAPAASGNIRKLLDLDI